MSDQQPPGGTTEYLESGGGGRLTPGSLPRLRGQSRRTTWLVGGGVVGALAIGAGAWAALSFFQQGAQPAEALPSTTVAYLSIDLDPSGGQKIDAFRTLNKFPAFKDQLGVHSTDDVRRRIGEEIIKGTGCDLSYDSDIGPWLGDRAAVAMVDLGGAEPEQVMAVQVTDDDAAKAGLKALFACDQQRGGDEGAFDVHGGWALIARTQADADKVVAETEQASLADDPTYQRWTKAVGDAGVVNMYAAPAAGRALAGSIGGLEGSFLGLSDSGSSSPQDGLTQALEKFQGAAATIRFNSDGVEFASASDPELSRGLLGSDQGGAVVSQLPDDTAAAIGLGLQPGWFTQVVGRVAAYAGHGQTPQQLMAELSNDSGLDLPADAETLLGQSAALSVSQSTDWEGVVSSAGWQGVPVAFTVKGDAAAIDQVLTKLRAQDPGSSSTLASDSSGGLVAIGPTAAYRQQVLSGGGLGDSDAFRGVVPDAAHASVVVYVDLASLAKAMTDIFGGDAGFSANIAPLRAFGLSAWLDGDVARTSVRLSTQ